MWNGMACVKQSMDVLMMQNDWADTGHGIPISLFTVEPMDDLACNICLDILNGPIQASALLFAAKLPKVHVPSRHHNISSVL
jgi:hypothetical protein